MNPIELKDLKTSAEAGLLGRIAALEAELEAKHQQYVGAVIQLEEARTHGEQYRKNWLALQAATGEDCQLHALDVIREARKDGERLSWMIDVSNSGMGWIEDAVWDSAPDIEGCHDVQVLIRAAIDAARGTK